MSSPILIDPDKIQKKIFWHQSEAKRLAAVLERIDELREFADEVPEKNGEGRGRPTVDNPYLQSLREFALGQKEDYSHQQIKDFLGNPDRRDLLRDAIDVLEKEGVLRIVQKPMGRRPGIYEPISNGKHI